MNKFTAVIEKCTETGLYVGYVPGFPGAHSQGETLDELHRNLQEVIGMLLEDGEPLLEGEFVRTHVVNGSIMGRRRLQMPSTYDVSGHT
ncbi:MAG: type II toxin-antitoxin system HicB family antitoxin [Syntrophobacteraceae bacterium]